MRIGKFITLPWVTACIKGRCTQKELKEFILWCLKEWSEFMWLRGKTLSLNLADTGPDLQSNMLPLDSTSINLEWECLLSEKQGLSVKLWQPTNPRLTNIMNFSFLNCNQTSMNWETDKEILALSKNNSVTSKSNTSKSKSKSFKTSATSLRRMAKSLTRIRV